jgi:hypothetical protein
LSGPFYGITLYRRGHCQNDDISALYDPEYMAAVREKLNIIKALKAGIALEA